jgi:Uma2 family endonuclease
VLEDLQKLESLLVASDGEPMDSPWHRAAMELLIQSILWRLRGRDDFYVGGNMFIYFSAQHVLNRDFNGPDFFFVNHVPLNPPRPFWVVWRENRFPDVIIEILSPTTERADRTTKRAVYEQTFRTPEYYLYDFDAGRFEGWRMNFQRLRYEPLAPDERGWLWSEQLELWLGPWDGEWTRMSHVRWPRFYDPEGRVVLTEAEFSRQEAQQAEEHARQAEEHARQADQRAAAAEAELARLKALLAERRPTGDDPGAAPG